MSSPKHLISGGGEVHAPNVFIRGDGGIISNVPFLTFRRNCRFCYAFLLIFNYFYLYFTLFSYILLILPNIFACDAFFFSFLNIVAYSLITYFTYDLSNNKTNDSKELRTCKVCLKNCKSCLQS